MKYYSKEFYINEKTINTAGVKARDDFDVILERMGFQSLPVYYDGLDRQGDALSRQIHIYSCVKAASAPLQKGDVLFMQFPMLQTTLLSDLLIGHLRRLGVPYVLLLHDLESLRHGKRVSTSLIRKWKTRVVEEGMLHSAAKIIVHNARMRDNLISMGIAREKLVDLELFDYLIPNYDAKRRAGKVGKDKPVIIAGNLRPHKSGYAYNLPSNCSFNLYGVDFTGELNVGSRYFGAFPPDELPYILRGSFGLVWDGHSSDTCTGVYGEYLRLNCPHKVSLYLASGIPVAIWKEAAMADFVTKNKVGIVISSLHELRETIDRLSEREYMEMVQNAERIGARLRMGYYSKAAIQSCMAALEGRKHYEKDSGIDRQSLRDAGRSGGNDERADRLPAPRSL